MIILCLTGCILILIGFFSNWIEITIFSGFRLMEGNYDPIFGPEFFSGNYFTDWDNGSDHYSIIMEAGYYPMLFLIPIAAIVTIFVIVISRLHDSRIISYLQWLAFALLIFSLTLPIEWYDRYRRVDFWRDILFSDELQLGWYISIGGAILSIISFLVISKFHFSTRLFE